MLHSGLMVRAGVISDELWALLEPVLPGVAGRPGRPWNDHRRTLEGIVWRFRTGSPWRDLPSEFGAYQSVWERHRRWSTDGTYNTMFAAVKANATDQDRQLMGTISMDSTSIRAHQHAAGARFHDHTGAQPNDKDLPGEPERSRAGPLARRVDHQDPRTNRRAVRPAHDAALARASRRQSHADPAAGRPPAFDAQTYCHRNTVERGFNRLKQWRGVATRYDCDDLPRRRHPGRHHHPPPRPQLADTL